MAINTSTITQLISDFRALSQKDSVSPESLGVLLQKLADLINSAASDADYKAIYDAFQKLVANIAAVPTALYKLEQGSADRNDILMNVTTSHLINGVTMVLKDSLFIRQATTERAGAMRAQQVSDLNSTRTGLAALQKSHTELASKVSSLGTTVSENGELLARVADESNYCSEGIADLAENLQVTNDDLAATQKSVEENARGITSIKAKTDCPRIAVEVVDGKLRVYNASYYTKNGYYPFVFRFTSKRNRCTLENYPDRKRGAKNKGWHVIGGLPNDVKIDSNGCVMFRTSPLEDWHHLGNDLISHSYEAKYVVGAKGSDEKMYIPWGKKKVRVSSNHGTYLMRRFRFAIGFAKSFNNVFATITPAHLVSNLAEFSVIFDPCTKEFHLGKHTSAVLLWSFFIRCHFFFHFYNRKNEMSTN